jgi:hypothetical protein
MAMTPDRLAELKERARRFEHIRSEHVLELIAEVERLQTQTEGLQLFIEHVGERLRAIKKGTP